jgi:hypothetical protein
VISVLTLLPNSTLQPSTSFIIQTLYTKKTARTAFHF